MDDIRSINNKYFSSKQVIYVTLEKGSIDLLINTDLIGGGSSYSPPAIAAYGHISRGSDIVSPLHKQKAASTISSVRYYFNISSAVHFCIFLIYIFLDRQT